MPTATVCVCVYLCNTEESDDVCAMAWKDRIREIGFYFSDRQGLTHLDRG